MEDDLVAWGRVLRLETRGRVTGRTARATVGYVERSDGVLVVAAGAEADWGLNLLNDPACRVTVGDAAWDARAQRLEGSEYATAIRDLILRYGTPAESLGGGPAFLLTRLEAGPGEPGPEAGPA